MKNKKLLIEIISDFIEYNQSLNLPQLAENGNIKFPLMIDAGEKGSIFVTQEIDRNIANYARKIKDKDQFISQRFDDDGFYKLVRNAFGPALEKIDLDEEVSDLADSVAEEVRKSLQKIKEKTETKQREIGFGCSLFRSMKDVEFKIGPVQFEPRMRWLERKVKDNHILKITEKRIRRAWNGEKLRQRKPSIDYSIERNIIEAVGKNQYTLAYSLRA